MLKNLLRVSSVDWMEHKTLFAARRVIEIFVGSHKKKREEGE